MRKQSWIKTELLVNLKENAINGILRKHKKVRSPDGDTEYFDIVAGVLQGDTLAP